MRFNRLFTPSDGRPGGPARAPRRSVTGRRAARAGAGAAILVAMAVLAHAGEAHAGAVEAVRRAPSSEVPIAVEPSSAAGDTAPTESDPAPTSADSAPAAAPAATTTATTTTATAATTTAPVTTATASSAPSTTSTAPLPGAHRIPQDHPHEPLATPGGHPAAPVEVAPGVTFVPGAQIYLRAQSRFNTNQSPDPGDRQSDILERARLSLGAKYGPVTAFVQVQDVRTWGFEASTVANEGNTDLHQGFLEIGGSRGERAGYLRVGRQEIVLGSKRLFADRNWNPNGQAFDAVRFHGQLGRFGADAVGLMLAPPQNFTVADPGGDPTLDRQVHSRGTYAGLFTLTSDLHRAFKSEVTVLGISERATPRAPTAKRDIVNLGGRIYGEVIPGLRYDVEGYAQLGENMGLRHRAFMGLGEVGYARATPHKPGVFGRYTYFSGDRCTTAPDQGCGNAESHDFYRFFGLRHAYYGLVDRVGPSNLADLEVGASIAAHPTVDISAGYHFFQLAQASGRWTNGPDQLVGKQWDPNNQSRNLGQEVDLVINWRPWKPLTIQPGYGVFVPLAAGRDLSGPAAQHFVYLWMIANF